MEPTTATAGPSVKTAVSAMDRLTVRGTLSEYLTRSRRHRVLDRVRIDQIAKEQDFQRKGLVNQTTIKKVGEMMGADFICTLELMRDESDFGVNVALIDVVNNGTQVKGLVLWDISSGYMHWLTYNDGSHPYEGTGIAASNGFVYVGGDMGVRAYNFSNPASPTVSSVISDGEVFSLKFTNGKLYAAGWASGSAGIPPCYWVGTTKTNLPWSSSGGVTWAESWDIAVGPDGAIHNCGRDSNSAPLLWRGTTQQTVPAWNATSSGAAWAIAVK
jgi:hypothetical protein